MRERLITLFDGLANQDQLQVLIEACDVLSDMNYRAHEDAIEQFFMPSDVPTGDAVFIVTEQILAPIFREYIQAMGVTPADDLKLKQLKDLLFWLHFIPDFEDQDVVHQLATPDESAVDTLIDILSIVSALPEEHFSVMIDDVSDSLITRIAELSDGKEVPEVPDPADFARAKERLLRYVGLLRQTQSELMAGIDLNDLRLGLSAEITLAKHRDALEQMDPKTCATLLLFYVLSSDAPDDAIIPIIGKEVELLFEDFLKGVEVTRLCETLLRQLPNA